MESSSASTEIAARAEASGHGAPSPYPLPQGEGKQQQAPHDAGKQQQDPHADGQQQQPPHTEAGGTPAPHSCVPAARRSAVLPEWQKISGLTPVAEAAFSRSERRFAIRKLFKEFERRIREALSECEREEKEEGNAHRDGDARNGGGDGGADNACAGHVLDTKNERTFLWSPLEGICAELGVARRKLSALTRELTGMAAQEVVDRIKAENVAARLKEKLAEKAKNEYASYFEQEEEDYRKRSKQNRFLEWEIRLNKVPPGELEAELKAVRARAEAGMNCEPRCGWTRAAGGLCSRMWNARRAAPGLAWSENQRHAARQQFARELGFSSYHRLYRACLLRYGKTLMELEHAAALELLGELDLEASGRREAVRGEVLKG